MGTPLTTDYLHVEYGNPHLKRMREILARHPEVRELFGPAPVTALWTLGIVALQLITAFLLKEAGWGWILLVSYLIGAVANHALFVVIHECTHNLVFKTPTTNRLLAIFANFPQFFPSAMGFSKYHMLHHTHQSEFDFDADLAGTGEARFIGNSPFRKALFLASFGLIQGLVRPARLKKVRFFDGWIVLNFLVQIGFLGLFFYFGGWRPLLYFFLSTFFGLGLHPMGGRWIQEHYLIPPEGEEGSNQETYSYYGPLNKLCFNMGYHNEHHDFMKIPWVRLPKVKALAPEYYDSLFFHRSWTALLVRFIFDPEITLFNRVVRPSRKELVQENKKEAFEPLVNTQPAL